MRKITFFCFLIIALCGCHNNEKSLLNSTIKTQSLGDVQCKFSMEYVMQYYKQKHIQIERVDMKETSATYFETIAYMNPQRTEFIRFQPNCIPECQVNQIITNSPFFKTEKNIGVGNSIGDLKKNYTPYYTLNDNHSIYMYAKELNQVGFAIDRPANTESKKANFTWDEIPDNLIIREIYIH